MAFALFTLHATASEEQAPRAKYGRQATRLHHAQEYVRKQPAPDFWALAPYYLPQFNGRACSVASVAMVINAARAGRSLTAADELVTQEGLLKKAAVESWKAAVGEGGKGVSLEELGQHTEKSLKAYGLKQVEVTVSHADGSAEFKDKLLKLLSQNEKSSSDFMLINFLQSEYTGDPEGAVGHIAPIAAYDARRAQVLVFDPDRQYYEPYWVSVETLIKGMATRDGTSGKARGFVYARFSN